MNNNQGLNPINGLMSSQEESSQVYPPQFVRPDFSEEIEHKLHIDGNALAKSILFVCDKCEGPLVPSSKCTVCHRTSLRKCTKCGNEVLYDLHKSCKYLVLLKELRSHRIRGKKKSVGNL